MRTRRRVCLLGGAVLCFFCFTIYFPILLSIRPEDVEMWNATRDMRVFLRPHNYTAIIDNANFCRQNSAQKSDDIFLLIIVCTSAGNFEQRKAIRETWGNMEATFKQLSPTTIKLSASEATDHDIGVRLNDSPKSPISYSYNSSVLGKYSNSSVRVTFLIGRTDNSSIQDLIYEENLKFKDMIQEDFQDTYNNLTLKSVMLLKWVNNTCPQARYIMKADDDTFVNVVNLVAYLEKQGRQHLLLGCVICGALPVRNRRSKWYVPRGFYNERYYPNYLTGTGYVLSADVVGPLYATALETPFFHLEDVYITGICAKRLKIKPVDHVGFSYLKRPLDPCVFHFSVTGHHVTPADMRTLWHQMHSKTLTCDTKKIKLKNFHPGKCS